MAWKKLQKRRRQQYKYVHNARSSNQGVTLQIQKTAGFQMQISSSFLCIESHFEMYYSQGIF